jgi:uncharacterized protein YegL
MELNTQFTFEKVRFDQDTDLHLVLGLKAPKTNWQQTRPPLCVIPVVDISGSMGGDKLHYAKQSLLKLIDHLSPTDQCGLVVFSSDARIEAPVSLMTPAEKDKIRSLINKLHVEGSTNFSGGMLLGLNMANKLDLSDGTIVRVIMFTDGQPTHGVTGSTELCALLGKQRGRATVSAFGYGVDARQELLGELASQGQGNFAFIRDPDGALAAFGKELGGLQSTYAQNITVWVTPHNGHRVREVISDVDVKEDKSEIEIKLPSLLSEETRNLVMAMRLTKQKAAGPRQVNAVDVRVRYEIIDADGKVQGQAVESKAKVQFVKPGEEQTHPTKEVDEIVAQAQLVKVQIEAEKAAQAGNFQAANAAFAHLNADLDRRGHVSSVGVASAHVGSLYANPGVYGDNRGRRVALRAATARGFGTSGMSAEDAAVLTSSNYQVSNGAQEAVANAFAAGVVPQVPSPLVVPPTPPVLVPEPVVPSDPGAILTPDLNSITKSRSARW